MTQMPEQMWRKMSTEDVENVNTGTPGDYYDQEITMMMPEQMPQC